MMKSPPTLDNSFSQVWKINTEERQDYMQFQTWKNQAHQKLSNIKRIKKDKKEVVFFDSTCDSTGEQDILGKPLLIKNKNKFIVLDSTVDQEQQEDPFSNDDVKGNEKKNMDPLKHLQRKAPSRVSIWATFITHRKFELLSKFLVHGGFWRSAYNSPGNTHYQ